MIALCVRQLGALLSVLVVLAAATHVAGCGVRTDPRPPEDTAARAPEDFEAKAVEDGVELSWERPTKTVDGGRLYDLASFAVERRRVEGPAESFETLVSMPVTDTDRLRTQRTFRFVDREPPQGILQYRVRAVTEDGEPGVASEVSISVPRSEPQGSQPR